MIVLTTDRILGVGVDEEPLSTYGPGNMLDDSNRNSWVSGFLKDKVTLDNNSQVAALFLGRFQSDEVKFSFFSKDLFGKISGGRMTIHGRRTYWNGGNAIKHELLTGDAVRTKSASDSASDVNAVGVANLTTITKINESVFYYDGASASSGEAVKVVSEGGAHGTNTFKVTEGSSSLAVNDPLRWVTANTVTVIAVTGGDLILKTANPHGLIVGDLFTMNSTNTLFGYIDTDNDNVTVANFLKTTTANANNPNASNADGAGTFYVTSIPSSAFTATHSSNTLTTTGHTLTNGEKIKLSGSDLPAGLTAKEYFVVNVASNTFKVSDTSGGDAVTFTDNGSGGTWSALNRLTLTRKTASGTTLKYNAAGGASGSGTHYLNVVKYGLVKAVSNDGSKTTVTIKDITSNATNEVDALFYGNVATATYSAMHKGVAITTATVQGYVADDSDGTITGTAGKSIHKAAVASRVSTSLGNFVQGKVTQVNSGFIPVPNQVEKSNIEIDFVSKTNRDGGKLISHWMLEDLTTSGNAYTIVSFYYNPANKGLLYLRTGQDMAAAGWAVGDYINVVLPTDLIYPTSGAIRAVATSSNSSAKTITFNSVAGIYKGMTSGSYGTVTAISGNTLTFSGTVGGSVSGNIDFANPTGVASDADIAFTRVHRIVKIQNADVNNEEIIVYAPNYGNNGDLTRATRTVFATGSGNNANGATNTVNSSPTAGRYAQKVTKGKGRFIREVSEQNTIATLAWDASSTGGTATATFTNDHGLVNNDKLVIYNLASVTNGSNIHNLEGSYLVTYSTSKEVTFNITKANQQTLSSLTGSSGSTTVTGVTAGDHGFVKGDKVHIDDSAAHDGLVTIASVPTSKSFTFTLSSALGGTLNDTTSGMQVTGGVHYRNSSGNYSDASTTAYTGSTKPTLALVPVARTISIDDAKNFSPAAGAADPIKVGNLLWIDGYEESSSGYASSAYAKTPTILTTDGTNVVYETGQYSDNRKQNTFIADFDSTTSTSLTAAAKNNSPLGQISLVKGDATSSGDIEFTPPVGKLNYPLRFTALRHGILVGILRAGSSVSFPNPQIGAGNKFKDYSVRKDLKTGSYYFLNRESAKIFNGKITGSPDEINPLVDFAQTQLAKPFAVLVMSGNATPMQKLRLRAAIYGYFTDLPSVSFSNKLNNLKDLQFNIKEVL